MQDDLEVLNVLITPSVNGRQASALALKAGDVKVTCRVSGGFLTHEYVGLFIFLVAMQMSGTCPNS